MSCVRFEQNCTSKKHSNDERETDAIIFITNLKKKPCFKTNDPYQIKLKMLLYGHFRFVQSLKEKIRECLVQCFQPYKSKNVIYSANKSLLNHFFCKKTVI
jgi:hypothetical protein